jgi:hypothetical protein
MISNGRMPKFAAEVDISKIAYRAMIFVTFSTPSIIAANISLSLIEAWTSQRADNSGTQYHRAG